MKLIIDIPEHFYEVCKADEDAIEIRLAVKNGIPLDDVIEKMEKEIVRDFAFAKTESLNVACHYGIANGLQIAVRIINYMCYTESEIRNE